MFWPIALVTILRGFHCSKKIYIYRLLSRTEIFEDGQHLIFPPLPSGDIRKLKGDGNEEVKNVKEADPFAPGKFAKKCHFETS